MSARTRPLPLPPEEDSITHAGATIPFRIVRSARRRKTFAIAVDHQTGVRILVPHRTPADTVRQLVSERAPWILARLRQPRPPHPAARQFVTGETLPYLGQQVPLTVLPGDGPAVIVTHSPAGFTVHEPPALPTEGRADAIRNALTAWYRDRAAETAANLIPRWAESMGVTPRRVLIRDQRSRWGSCGADGTIRLNWRLILAEPAIFEYVAVHELAHLRQRNHSPAFWAVVEAALPGHRVLRARLRQSAPHLNL